MVNYSKIFFAQYKNFGAQYKQKFYTEHKDLQ